MIQIWQRYIFKQFIKLFAFFLIGFYLLYVIIDYTTHMQGYMQGKTVPVLTVGYYYLLQFIKRADILLPLALLVATIKTLTSLNSHRELLAFQSAGLHLKKLLRPIWVMSVLCGLSVLAINEYVVPYSLNFIDQFYDAHLRHSYRGNRTEPIHVLHLDDHSRLVYQYYDSAKESFFDVVWLRSADDLYRMKYLKADPEHPEGKWVDHLQRNEMGSFEKVQSFRTITLPDLRWNKDLPEKGYTPFENRSISELWKLWRYDPILADTQKQEVMTQLFFKLLSPLLAIVVLLGVSPYCTHFSRTTNVFLIYSVGIFGFVALIAYLDSAVILGENATVSPLIGILSPFIVLISMLGLKFSRS